MSATGTDEPNADYAAIAAEILGGDDPYVVPADLLDEPDPPRPVRKSLYAEILALTVGERIKLALKGNRDARAILIRDPNRLIQQFVLQNPRITDEEIIAIARNRNTDSDLLRMIGNHKYWPRNYQVRAGLVTNPKAPLAVAIHYVGQLTERDLRQLAKSKNVSSAVVGHARRLLALREQGR